MRENGNGDNAVMISVIMLTYNREDMVGRAIRSVLNQTFSDFELIIVDNGSADRSGKIAEEFAGEDKRIRVIHKKRGNIGSGRNAGLDLAKGQYIAFVDDDDWVERDFLEFLVHLLREMNADISICGTTSRCLEEKVVMTAEEALVELMWRRKYNTGFPTKLFRRELFKEARFSETEKSDDIGLIYKLMADAKRVAYHGLSKYNVCRHPGNNSAWTTNYQLLTSEILKEYLQIYHVRTEWLSDRFPGRADVFRYFEWSFMLSMVEKICRRGLSECEELLVKMREELRIHRQEFLNMPEVTDFERDWMEKYITDREKAE